MRLNWMGLLAFWREPQATAGSILPRLFESKERLHERLKIIIGRYRTELSEDPFGFKEALKLRLARASTVLSPLFDTFIGLKREEDRFDIYTVGTGRYAKDTWYKKLCKWMDAGVRVHYVIIGEAGIKWVDELAAEYSDKDLFEFAYASMTDPQTRPFAEYYFDYHPTILVMEREQAEGASASHDLAMWLEQYHVENDDNEADYVSFFPPAYLKHHARHRHMAEEHLERMRRILRGAKTHHQAA